MRRPQLHDDGRSVMLDLHGARVDEALDMVRRTARLAAARGRVSIRVVHGRSTSDPLVRNRTIRHALHDALDQGAFTPPVVDDLRGDDSTILALPVTVRRSATRIQLRDVLFV